MNPWFARASASLLLGCSLGLAQDSAGGQVLSFTAQDESTTATAECALSLDGRRMRLAFKPHGCSEQTMILDRVAE